VQNNINSSIAKINQITNSSFYFLDGHFNKSEVAKKFYEQQINLYIEKKIEFNDLKNISENNNNQKDYNQNNSNYGK
jgi:hypothetical protein